MAPLGLPSYSLYRILFKVNQATPIWKRAALLTAVCPQRLKGGSNPSVHQRMNGEQKVPWSNNGVLLSLKKEF